MWLKEYNKKDRGEKQRTAKDIEQGGGQLVSHDDRSSTGHRTGHSDIFLAGLGQRRPYLWHRRLSEFLTIEVKRPLICGITDKW
jgi:hypothetical protein